MIGMTGTKIYELPGETSSANYYKLLLYQNIKWTTKVVISLDTQRK